MPRRLNLLGKTNIPGIYGHDSLTSRRVLCRSCKSAPLTAYSNAHLCILAVPYHAVSARGRLSALNGRPDVAGRVCIGYDRIRLYGLSIHAMDITIPCALACCCTSVTRPHLEYILGTDTREHSREEKDSCARMHSEARYDRKFAQASDANKLFDPLLKKFSPRKYKREKDVIPQ